MRGDGGCARGGGGGGGLRKIFGGGETVGLGDGGGEGGEGGEGGDGGGGEGAGEGGVGGEGGLGRGSGSTVTRARMLLWCSTQKISSSLGVCGVMVMATSPSAATTPAV